MSSTALIGFEKSVDWFKLDQGIKKNLFEKAPAGLTLTRTACRASMPDTERGPPGRTARKRTCPKAGRLFPSRSFSRLLSLRP